MRAPRALIPLLAVGGATAVLAAAGAGAAIKELPSFGPAHADGRRAPAPASVTAVTWNVCGDAEPGCRLGSQPAELTRRIVQQAGTAVVGGRKVRPNVLFLQEICSGHLTTLGRSAAMDGWSWAFAPNTKADGKPRACVNGQGQYGVALGVRAKAVDVRQAQLPAPPAHGRAAVCATVNMWRARLCSAQLSSARWDDDPRGEWRRKQTRQLASLAGQGRVVIAGDFTDRPDGKPLDPLYRDYAECDQGPEARDGASTLQDWQGRAVAKTDYLFTTKSASISCGVAGTPTTTSDHRPMAARVRFR
ncbi:endonuclease/exonuclease/phosphatase family protein [Actinomadura hibisca]|uniref:endonuclease/exonuclease/phosphatase family protein n=1 Tax=Actinomadura hibisca TaxID=68565 RepID=UPI0008368574|nr:endonuclease/exonuclease/phosphatase family protein [Actinomadura hibisca]